MRAGRGFGPLPLHTRRSVLSYFPKTFLTSPTFRSTLPSTFSAVPRSLKVGLPSALPVSSFILPTASLAVPLILSFVLELIIVHRACAGFRLGLFRQP